MPSGRQIPNEVGSALNASNGRWGLPTGNYKIAANKPNGQKEKRITDGDTTIDKKKEKLIMNTKTKLIGKASVPFLAGSILVAGCAGGSLTHEKKPALAPWLWRRRPDRSWWSSALVRPSVAALASALAPDRRPTARTGEHQLPTATAINRIKLRSPPPGNRI
jgi:hypothetical protein